MVIQQKDTSVLGPQEKKRGGIIFFIPQGGNYFFLFPLNRWHPRGGTENNYCALK